jgi:hypothetical protein
VVDPVIGNARFSKVLMDGGSSLNILYAHTLRLLGIGLDQLRPSTTPFHGVTPGKRVQPLGQIDLPVWFGTPDSYRKETLTFEVVGFRGAYHAILGRSCYAKFMVVPNYTYLKMKMSGPNDVITVGSSIEHAFDCDVECVEHAEALALDEALVANLEKLVNEDLDSTTKHAGSFEAAEQTKGVPLDHAARGQGVEGQFHPRPEIGSGARRLSPRQRRHLRVEPFGYATAVVAAGCGSVSAAGCCGPASVAGCCGSMAATACCASAATGSGSMVVAASCGSEGPAASREPLVAAVTVLTAVRDALDERRLVGTTASVLSTLADARGGTADATLRTRRQEILGPGQSKNALEVERPLTSGWKIPFSFSSGARRTSLPPPVRPPPRHQPSPRRTPPQQGRDASLVSCLATGAPAPAPGTVSSAASAALGEGAKAPTSRGSPAAIASLLLFLA